MVNILVCDDHKHTRKMLEKISSENIFIKNIFSAADGLDAAKQINKISPDTKFIFITAQMEYAIDSFSVHPYNYLLKPIDISVFIDNLNALAMNEEI